MERGSHCAVSLLNSPPNLQCRFPARRKVGCLTASAQRRQAECHCRRARWSASPLLNDLGVACAGPSTVMAAWRTPLTRNWGSVSRHASFADARKLKTVFAGRQATAKTGKPEPETRVAPFMGDWGLMSPRVGPGLSPGYHLPLSPTPSRHPLTILALIFSSSIVPGRQCVARSPQPLIIIPLRPDPSLLAFCCAYSSLSPLHPTSAASPFSSYHHHDCHRLAQAAQGVL